MNKFEDVDVIASLEAIMKQNTAFYQNDFDLDRNILQKAAASPTAEDRRLLWFSRPSGTSCFRERGVLICSPVKCSSGISCGCFSCKNSGTF